MENKSVCEDSHISFSLHKLRCAKGNVSKVSYY